MPFLTGKGKITIKKSGTGYKNVWIYVPSNLAKDSAFPFKDQEEVEIEIRNKQLIVSSRNSLMDRIVEYGLENATLRHLIETKAVENADRPFLLFNDQTFTYRQINEEANRIAHGLLDLVGDFTRRDPPKIAVFLPNCPEFLFCWFGICKTGMIFVPIDQFLRGDSLKYVLRHCDCDYLILDYNLLPVFKEVQDDLPRITKIFVRNPPAALVSDVIYSNFSQIVSNNIENPDTLVQALDVMEIIYTEGTTGKPKAVIYRNVLVLAGLIVSDEINTGKYFMPTRAYCPTPLFQAFAQLVIVFPALFLNASIAIAEKFDATTFWDDVRRYKTDLIVYYGGILQTLFNQPPRENDRDHPAKWAIGGEAPRHIWENFENRFGITLYEGWAPTEAVAFTINMLGSKGGKLGSIGTPLDGFEVKVVGEDGNELPPGPEHIGEIVTKTTFPGLLEYYKKPEGNSMVRGKDDYIYTGDMAYRDNDGSFFYTGRKSDIIRRPGSIILAHVVENVANAHPAILESAVFGVPSHKSGTEDIKICAVRKNTQIASVLTHAQFHEYLRENLANFMVPRFIEFRPMLRNSSERIKKYRLREEWQKEEVKARTWDAQTQTF